MIVRRPDGHHITIADPIRTYAPFERVDGTIVTSAELDRVIDAAARPVADWMTPINVQRAPAKPKKPKVPKSEQPRYQRHTHCIRGHPLEGDNVLIADAGNGRIKRGCRQCRRDRERLYRETRNAA